MEAPPAHAMDDAALDAELHSVNLEYNKCTLGHWQKCALGMAIGLPISAYKRSHLFWAIGGVSGTLMDFADALEDCKHLSRRSRELAYEKKDRRETRERRQAAGLPASSSSSTDA